MEPAAPSYPPPPPAVGAPARPYLEAPASDSWRPQPSSATGSAATRLVCAGQRSRGPGHCGGHSPADEDKRPSLCPRVSQVTACTRNAAVSWKRPVLGVTSRPRSPAPCEDDQPRGALPAEAPPPAEGSRPCDSRAPSSVTTLLGPASARKPALYNPTPDPLTFLTVRPSSPTGSPTRGENPGEVRETRKQGNGVFSASTVTRNLTHGIVSDVLPFRPAFYTPGI